MHRSLQLLLLLAVCAARGQYDQLNQVTEAIPAPTPLSSYTPEPYDRVLHRDEPKHREPPKSEPEAPASSELPPKKVEPALEEEESPKTPEESAKAVCGVDDVLFVLDSTGSVRTFYDNQKNYIISLVENLDISPEGQHVGLVKYSSHRRQRTPIELDVGIDKTSVIAKVKDVTFNGGITETGAALRYVKTALEKRRKEKRTAVVVLTDGFSFDDVTAPATDLRGIPDVTVFVAGLTHPVVREVLVDIAGDESRVLLGEEGKALLIASLKC